MGMYFPSTEPGSKTWKPETRTLRQRPGCAQASEMAMWAPRERPMMWALPFCAFEPMREARVETQREELKIGWVEVESPWPGRSESRMW